jgi:hypothetical protein
MFQGSRVGTGSTLSIVSTTEGLLGKKKKVGAPVYKAENRAVGIRCPDRATPSVRKSSHIADKRRSLIPYSSLAY